MRRSSRSTSPPACRCCTSCATISAPRATDTSAIRRRSGARSTRWPGRPARKSSPRGAQRMTNTLWARLGWILFAAQVSAVGAYTVHVYRKTPRATGNADIAPDGKRFGITEEKRREYFAQMMRGEKENRESAEKMKEQLIWNRNHDSYFHQHEWGRIIWWSHH